MSTSRSCVNRYFGLTTWWCRKCLFYVDFFNVIRIQMKSSSSTKQTTRYSQTSNLGTLYILTIRSDLLSRMNPLADSRRHDSLLIRYPWESRLEYSRSDLRVLRAKSYNKRRSSPRWGHSETGQALDGASGQPSTADALAACTAAR